MKFRYYPEGNMTKQAIAQAIDIKQTVKGYEFLGTRTLVSCELKDKIKSARQVVRGTMSNKPLLIKYSESKH